MSLSGPDALQSIEEALRDIRREEAEIVRRLGHSAELVTKIRTQEGELYRQLLSMRLEQPARVAVSDEIARAEVEATAMLARHDADLDLAAAAIDELDDSLAATSSNRAALQKRAAERDAELRALAAKARPGLSKNADYMAHLTAARELARAAEASLRKTAEAEADRERKGRPYRDDPVFMYLWEKAYGAKTYRANGLVTWLDGWIAGVIGYGRARANFLLLNEIPLRLREHADRQRLRAEAAAIDVSKLEGAAVDSAGGKSAREAIEAIVGQIATADREMVRIEDQRDEAIRAQRELAQGDDAVYAPALKALTGLLRRGDLKAMLAEARSTPKGQDPTIIEQIDDLRRRTIEEEEEAREQRQRLRTLAARRRDLENLIYEIKAQGFDNPHSSFSDENLVGETLNVFLHGEINLTGYWERWRLSQTWDLVAGYGGPGGGWGRVARPVTSGIGRPRATSAPARPDALTSAA